MNSVALPDSNSKLGELGDSVVPDVFQLSGSLSAGCASSRRAMAASMLFPFAGSTTTITTCACQPSICSPQLLNLHTITCRKACLQNSCSSHGLLVESMLRAQLGMFITCRRLVHRCAWLSEEKKWLTLVQN